MLCAQSKVYATSLCSVKLNNIIFSIGNKSNDETHTHTARSKPTLRRRLILFVKPFAPVFLRKFLNHIRKFLNHIKQVLATRDLLNIVRYGLSAPKFADRIYIDPNKVLHHSTAGFSRNDSGLVADGEWDTKIEPITNIEKIKIVYKFIEDNKTWAECGAYKNMALIMKTRPGADGCFTQNDVIKRYERLTQLITHLKSGGKFLEGRIFRESGGVYIHIGRQGQPIFGGGGSHRLAISQKLNLPIIPCQIGVVHAEFLKENPNQMKALKIKPAPPQP